MELLDALLQRSVIIALAIAGAAVATFGNILRAKSTGLDPRLVSLIVRSGYAIAWSSVALFIIAGFRSAYV